ncbi:hypothetical protein C5B42_01540 [Candidatus Cerribacteria bacterium 'Amazon FNV 2010 28 9']|uniref:LytR/CpsA/Psr regulator C-terminal domain-containing protein n=1 Tax=Candidatus Cerribacteria bacterium 'Amazon FNV 2010 28 9' TaxID=2081795 RepID=A0A317JPS9_9BACT|nr:MAG: hypothetical protein C5B42_01540 [Candidatus Cerribacteria bacterium 'Amazon FNV 2010 28 9']
MLVSIFIILGMVLVAAGIVGLYVMTKKSSDQPIATPAPQATPVPTPTVVVATPTPTPDPALLKSVKVNVLNGTTTKGLAAKEAAVLKSAGFTLGTVGNGSPSDAGTISVPTGKTAIADAIKAALTGFTFTVTEDAKATQVTVTLGAPSSQ